jgi:hypothetical protein
MATTFSTGHPEYSDFFEGAFQQIERVIFSCVNQHDVKKGGGVKGLFMH